jgi:mono/diheme cytochrome c family protein
MRSTHLGGPLLAALLASQAAFAQTTALRPPQDFAAIADQSERSRALFAELGKVIESPRCQNCHPAGDRPSQGNDLHPHQPLVVRGADDHGAIGLRCATCHQAANYEPAGVPGNPKWGVAPIEMAWQGKSLGAICEQIKDPARNGRRSLAQIHEHMAHDDLVGWGWRPGAGRTPAPGTQAQFGALVAEWIKTGAACPAS